MNVFEAALYGFVEGLTEFLPISSTAHLILLSKLFGLEQTEFISFFEVFIQAGAILAVLFLYFDYVRKHFKVLQMVLFSFIPTAVVGFLARDTIKNVFFKSNTIITASIIGVGLLFLVVEWLISQKKLTINRSISQITLSHALIIGLIQSFAIVPGVSRAGAVIVAMLFLKYKRSEAAIYSFLLAVPTILGASLLDLFKTDFSGFTVADYTNVLVGLIVSFVSALIFIKWFIRFLQHNTLVPFALYRILLGAILLMMFAWL